MPINDTGIAGGRASGHGPGVVDLEERVARRDRGFLVRLVLALVAGTVVGLMLYAQLTGDAVAGCAAQRLGEPVPSEADPAP
ncbi:MAG: hypothetical protein ACFCGT_19255 [Sandaracinaceae bacterium]